MADRRFIVYMNFSIQQRYEVLSQLVLSLSCERRRKSTIGAWTILFKDGRWQFHFSKILLTSLVGF